MEEENGVEPETRMKRTSSANTSRGRMDSGGRGFKTGFSCASTVAEGTGGLSYGRAFALAEKTSKKGMEIQADRSVPCRFFLGARDQKGSDPSHPSLAAGGPRKEDIPEDTDQS